MSIRISLKSQWNVTNVSSFNSCFSSRLFGKYNRRKLEKMTEKKFNSKIPPASVAAVNNNSNNNNAAAAKAEREERLRSALKAFVLKERQRKKEEYDAKEEEERLRKEREDLDHQNDVSLEDTRGKIAKLDQQIKDLHNRKQQLFLQLKKVLNEDENRKKQQKDNEMFAMQALQAQQASVAPPPPQVFIPPVRIQHHQMPITTKPVANQPVKRTRSPSPPTHQSYYKNTTYTQPKHEDVRRASEYPRVAWNKPPAQYQGPGALFYPAAGNAPQPQPDGRGPAIIYPYGLPLRQGFHLDLQPNSSAPVSKSDQTSSKPTQVYHISLDAPPISQAGSVSSVQPGVQSQKPQITMEKINDRYHPDVKHDGNTGHGPPHQLPEGVVYTPMMPGMSLHPNIMQINSNPGQNPKTAQSITQGYAGSRSAVAAHDHLARQPQIMQPGQPGQPNQQQMNYPRRMY
ncbi:G protein pathway suppressor 2 isoform X2 [Eurosta solidaginis]|uniref:G protein pathway suppressor 2 isoform X2 n=1 Tax=Eurosta solidaginis TaxID=178769 RepID=UPI0035307648